VNFDFSAKKKNGPERMACLRRPFVRFALPCIVFLLGAVAAFLFAWKLFNDQSNHIKRLSFTEAQIVKRKLVRAGDIHVEMLQRMVARWQATDGTQESLWRADAHNTLKHSREILSLSWIDREGQLQWVETTPYDSSPEPGSARQTGPFLMHSVEGRSHMATLQAEPLKSLTVSHTTTISKDHNAVMISAPIWTGNVFEGYLNAVVNITSLYDQFLENDFRAGFSLCLHEGEKVIFQKFHDPEDYISPWLIEDKVNFIGQTFLLHVWPSRKLSERIKSNLPIYFFLAGLFLSLALALASYFGLRILIHKRSLEKAHRNLEIAYKQQQDTNENLRTQSAQLTLLSDKVQAARKVADASNMAKDRFLASMSHEIRTPLNAIIGFAGVLSNSQLDDEQHDHLHYLQDAAENLLVLLNDILDLAKIDAEKLELTESRIELSGLLEGTRLLWSAGNKQSVLNFVIEIDPQVPCVIYADKTRLRQVLFNLVSNALKFTERGEVNIRVTATGEGPPEAPCLKFEVSDTGIGIAEEHLDALFDRFTQADSSITRNYGGTGLGLSICQQLVALMGGDIGVKSAAGLGSTFWFTLHCRAEMAMPESQPSPSLPAQSSTQETPQTVPLTVLLAEDNVVNQKVIQAILAAQHHQVDIAQNGLEAIEAVQNKSYDLILMDLRMPKMDGFTAIERIRQLSHAQTIPIIVLSANTSVEDQNRALSAGAQICLTKPIKPADLLASIQQLTLLNSGEKSTKNADRRSA